MGSKTDHKGFWLRFARRRLRPNVLVKALSGAAVLWWLLPDSDTPSMTIHKRFCRQCWHDDGVTGVLVLCAGFVLWIPMMLVLIATYSWRCAARVRAETGKGIVRQMAEQGRLAFGLAVPPPWYYMFEFYLDAHRARAMEYLYRTETKSGLYHMLQRRLTSRSSLNALSDKALFAQRCRANGLAVVAIVATATEGLLGTPDGSGELPAIDLFFKPRRGAGGRGASRWMYLGNGFYLGSDGSLVDASALKQHLIDLSTTDTYIVRPYVCNHPDITAINGGALSTVRIVTVLDESNRPVATHAVLRMASNADAVVDNFHCGGIAARIDMDNGRLGDATNMGVRAGSRWHTTHPMTGAMIEHRLLPYWNEVPALACRAHEAFPDQVAIGWDIAILADGAYLVEGNKGPDLDIIQRVSREPVGNSRLGALLAHHITLALDNEARIHAAAR